MSRDELSTGWADLDGPPGPARIAYDHAGAGEAVVFLHGVGGDARLWRPQMEALRDGFRVIAWDARGYHRSGGHDPPLSIATLAEDLAGLLDELRLDRAHVVGHSMGGLVAQHAYHRFPDRFASLVLANSTRSLRGALTEAELDAFLAARRAPIEAGACPADIAGTVSEMLLAARAGPSARDAVRASFGDLRPRHYLNALEMVTRYEPVLPLADVQVPTLVICGSDDRVTPPAASLEIARGVAGSVYVELQGAGHMTNLERPEAFNRVLRAFLEPGP